MGKVPTQHFMPGPQPTDNTDSNSANGPFKLQYLSPQAQRVLPSCYRGKPTTIVANNYMHILDQPREIHIMTSQHLSHYLCDTTAMMMDACSIFFPPPRFIIFLSLTQHLTYNTSVKLCSGHFRNPTGCAHRPQLLFLGSSGPFPERQFNRHFLGPKQPESLIF